MRFEFYTSKYLLIGLLGLICSTIEAQTTFYDSILSGGRIRNYKVYVPAIYDSTVAVPLVFNLHGYGSNFNEQEQYGDFRAIADTANFIIVHPNGTIDSQNSLAWNTFDYDTVNDIGFIADLIETIKQNYNIDTAAVYSTGMSNGGFMSYDLACQLSQKIAAVASVTGTMITAHLAACNAQHPMPIMQIHGTADGTVLYGGVFILEPIENIVKYWAEFNHCDTIPILNAIPNVVVNDNCTAEHYVYTNGEQGVEVEFYKIIGGGHSWPGAPININTTNMDFSASKEIWRFFRKHKLRESNVGLMAQKSFKESSFNLFPNPSSASFKIEFPTAEHRVVEIFNSLGQLLAKHNSTGLQLDLNLEEKGVYYIAVHDKKGENQTKIMIVL